MQQRGEGSAQPRWGGEFDQHRPRAHDDASTQVQLRVQADAQAQAEPVSAPAAQPAPAPTSVSVAERPPSPRRSAAVKTRPWWKTPSIATVALVAGIALGVVVGRSSKTSDDASSALAVAASASASAAPKAVPPGAPVKSVVLQVSGNASKTTKTFVVVTDWSVTYSYDCSGFGKAGTFSVIEHGGDGIPLPIVNVAGRKGSKVAYQHRDGGQRALEIDSRCDWTLTVTSGDAG